MEGNKPIGKVKKGVYEVAVWNNPIPLKEGKGIIASASFSLTRSYLDKEEKWHNQTINFNSEKELRSFRDKLNEIDVSNLIEIFKEVTRE